MPDRLSLTAAALLLALSTRVWKKVTNLPTGKPSLNAVWGLHASSVWAAGSDAAVWHFGHFNGTKWTQQMSNTKNALRSVWGRNATDVWAVGLGGTVLHHDGAGWKPHTVSTSASLNGVGHGRR